MKTHELKTFPPYFEDIDAGIKTFEVRKHDRPFKLNDILHLKEWNSYEGKYTQRELFVKITYILIGGQFGIEFDYCVLGIIKTD